MELFGFSIKRKQDENKNIPSFVRPNEEDGSVNIAALVLAVVASSIWMVRQSLKPS